jgi:sugar/nucleoside kinase (ribokinase family)
VRHVAKVTRVSAGVLRWTFVARTTPFTAVVPGLDNTEGIVYDVVGIGNALVDIIAQVENDFLHEQKLVKGSMALIDTDRAVALYEAVGRNGVQTSGGSAANTIAGLASLGADVAFIGKVADDDLGRAFAQDLERLGVEFHSGGPQVEMPTGRCIIAVTPDAERTMNTYLGVSTFLAFDDVDADLVETGAVLYMEGYLFDRDEAKNAFRKAAERAHSKGRVVSLTLSDSFCVDRHRDDFRALVRDEIDLLFANENELLSLYETDVFDDAVSQLRKECHIACVTRSEKGSVIVTPVDVHSVPAKKVTRVVDTTGAGDLFAAGFLRGYTRGFDLTHCAQMGAIAAAEVIAHVGPRPEVSLIELLPPNLR